MRTLFEAIEKRREEIAEEERKKQAMEEFRNEAIEKMRSDCQKIVAQWIREEYDVELPDETTANFSKIYYSVSENVVGIDPEINIPGIGTICMINAAFRRNGDAVTIDGNDNNIVFVVEKSGVWQDDFITACMMVLDATEEKCTKVLYMT